MDSAHQAASLAVKVGVDFLLESGFVEVPTTNSDTKCNGFLLGLSSDILIDGNGRVDASSFAEEGSYSAAGAFGCDENDIYVGGDIDFGLFLEDGGESMGEVEGLVFLAIDL